MIHKVRVLELIANAAIVTTDFGEREDNWDYQNQPLPPGIVQNQVAKTAYCNHTALAGVTDTQAQVSIDVNNAVVVDLQATTLQEQRATVLANASTTMQQLATDPNVSSDVKTYLNALWAFTDPDRFIAN